MFHTRNSLPKLLTTCGYKTKDDSYELAGVNSEYPTFNIEEYAPSVVGNGVKFAVHTLENKQYFRKIQLITVIYRGEPLALSLTQVEASARHLGNFDLTPCCVNLMVSRETGELHWQMPYLTDIVAGAMSLTPQFRAGAEIALQRNYLVPLRRMQKYGSRGYLPTKEMERFIVHLREPDDFIIDKFCDAFATLRRHS